MAVNQDLYGIMGSVPQDVHAGGEGTPFGVRSSGANFGGQVAQGAEELGAGIHAFGQDELSMQTQFAHEATESLANNTYANTYAVKAAGLRNEFDQLQGQDKILGYQKYIGQLQDLNQQTVSSMPSLLGQRMMSSLVNRHVEGEIMGANRELAASQKQFSIDAAYSKVKADSNYAAQNYNNPQIVNQVVGSNNATILLKNIDNGMDPNDPSHQAVIQQEQKDVQGQMATQMIDKALQSGDLPGAVNVRKQFGTALPASSQLHIDNVIHAEDLRQTSANTMSAALMGLPLPQSSAAPPVQVQATVADVAQQNGIDPNHALTVARIESSYGQNLGKRGDIGQTGKPAADLKEQASNMVDALKEAKDSADSALGRPSEPWEQYCCYQQGAGGGPALLKASMETPNARAVDVLSQLYKNPKDALSAITSNGGNASMTAGDYIDFLKQKYQSNAQRAMCEIPQSMLNAQKTPEGNVDVTQQTISPKLSDALMQYHDQQLPAMQKAATPMGEYKNFMSKYNDMYDAFNANPNIEMRQGLIDRLNHDRSHYEANANAYLFGLNQQVEKLAYDPKFTKVDQVPAALASELSENNPKALRVLQSAAEYNLNRSSGTVTKDMTTYGPQMFNLMRQIHDGTIKGQDQLMDYLPGGQHGENGITLAGYKQLSKEFSSDPVSASDKAMQMQAFKLIKTQISAEHPSIGSIKDPEGEVLYAKAMPILFDAIDQGKNKGLTMAQLTDPESPNYIGNSVKSLIRSPTQQNIDMLTQSGQKTNNNASLDKTMSKDSQLQQLYSQYQSEKDQGKKRAIVAQAKKLGLLGGAAPPEVPIAR